LTGDGPLQGIAILVVEDDPEIRQMLGIVLTSAGARTTDANSGAAALAAVESAEPDVLLVDWNLPDMNGGALLDTMHAGGHVPSARALVITGGLLADDTKRITGRSGHRILRKPFRPAALVEAIQQLLSAA